MSIDQEIAALDRIARSPAYDLALCHNRMSHVMCFGDTAQQARALGCEQAQARMDDEMSGLEEHLHYMRTGEVGHDL